MSTTWEGSPVRTIEQNRRRRARAGKCGGKFELVRDGEKYTYRYASPDRRRYEPDGEFSWEWDPSTGDHADLHAIDIHDQDQANLSPIQSLWADDMDDTLVEQAEEKRTNAGQQNDEYEESVYSKSASDGKEESAILSPIGNSETQADAVNDTNPRHLEVQQKRTEEGSLATAIVNEEGPSKSASQSPPEKNIATKHSVKRFGNTIVQRGNGVRVVQKLSRFFSRTLRGNNSSQTGKKSMADGGKR